MPSTPTERKLAAILSADVVGYSRLMAEDEAGTIRTLTTYREEVELHVRRHRGRLVDFTGDNFLAEFPTALEAVRSAVEIQRVLQVQNSELPTERRMDFRMGIHLGEVAAEGERLFGDGVNIAARLQALADPGGVCVSRNVYDLVHTKLGVGFDDLGTKSVKNIPDPVRVYRVESEAETVWPETSPRSLRRTALAVGAVILLGAVAFAGWRIHLSSQDEETARAEDFTVPGFGSVPAIAVLPFDNLSGDPEQEYFADGISEDLITRLSSWRSFPVIARNSSFVYKGQAVDVKRVSRELGARYVVEGSVRKAGDRVRISAQLIEATSGHHVWAETYDRELQDIFELQDEITESVVASIWPELFRTEVERIAHQQPSNLDAWESAMRGMWHLSQTSEEDNAKARLLFERASSLAPDSSRVFAQLVFVHFYDVWFQWTESPEQSVAEVHRAARRSAQLNPNDPAAQLALCLSYQLMGRQDERIAAARRAIELDPSSPMGYVNLGAALSMVGRPEEALPQLEKAMRLNPRDPQAYFVHWQVGLAHFSAREYEKAVEWARRSLRANSRLLESWRLLAASYAHLGQLDKARQAVEEHARLQPEYSVSTVRLIYSGSSPDLVQRMVEGLYMAGLWE